MAEAGMQPRFPTLRADNARRMGHPDSMRRRQGVRLKFVTFPGLRIETLRPRSGRLWGTQGRGAGMPWAQPDNAIMALMHKRQFGRFDTTEMDHRHGRSSELSITPGRAQRTALGFHLRSALTTRQSAKPVLWPSHMPRPASAAGSAELQYAE